MRARVARWLVALGMAFASSLGREPRYRLVTLLVASVPIFSGFHAVVMVSTTGKALLHPVRLETAAGRPVNGRGAHVCPGRSLDHRDRRWIFDAPMPLGETDAPAGATCSPGGRRDRRRPRALGLAVERAPWGCQAKPGLARVRSAGLEAPLRGRAERHAPARAQIDDRARIPQPLSRRASCLRSSAGCSAATRSGRRPLALLEERAHAAVRRAVISTTGLLRLRAASGRPRPCRGPRHSCTRARAGDRVLDPPPWHTVIETGVPGDQRQVVGERRCGRMRRLG